MLIDSYNRSITYLRVSVTDRCNLRCLYCMPAGGIEIKSHHEILSYEEVTQIVKIAVENGIRSVRITGGEPLVRKGITELVSKLSAIPGLEDLSMTTNGILLEQYAQSLADSGLNRVNVSLDTLDGEKFRRITRGGDIERVWCGIAAAEKAGLLPVKLNTVVMGGINEDEIEQMAELALSHPWHIRFIEWMPVREMPDLGDGMFDMDKFFVSTQKVYEKLRFMDLQPVESGRDSGPAKLFQPKHGQGWIGIISAIGEHFCGQCNRLRLTADGKLRSCLFSNDEIALLPVVRHGDDILPYLRQAVQMKPVGHSLAREKFTSIRGMSQIGG